jgi:hypothetical protein
MSLILFLIVAAFTILLVNNFFIGGLRWVSALLLMPSHPPFWLMALLVLFLFAWLLRD